MLCISTGGGFIGGVVFIGGCGGDQKWEEDKQCLSWLQPQKHVLDYNALRGSDAGTTSTSTSVHYHVILSGCTVQLVELCLGGGRFIGRKPQSVTAVPTLSPSAPHARNSIWGQTFGFFREQNNSKQPRRKTHRQRNFPLR